MGGVPQRLGAKNSQSKSKDASATLGCEKRHRKETQPRVSTGARSSPEVPARVRIAIVGASVWCGREVCGARALCVRVVRLQDQAIRVDCTVPFADFFSSSASCDETKQRHGGFGVHS
jgi:hypothetical protein